MEIHQLTYFVAVAETGNFSRAAERCNISQPSLSQQIQKLEQELGEALFERLPRKVVLTDAGRILLLIFGSGVFLLAEAINMNPSGA